MFSGRPLDPQRDFSYRVSYLESRMSLLMDDNRAMQGHIVRIERMVGRLLDRSLEHGERMARGRVRRHGDRPAPCRDPRPLDPFGL